MRCRQGRAVGGRRRRLALLARRPLPVCQAEYSLLSCGMVHPGWPAGARRRRARWPVPAHAAPVRPGVVEADHDTFETREAHHRMPLRPPRSSERSRLPPPLDDMPAAAWISAVHTKTAGHYGRRSKGPQFARRIAAPWNVVLCALSGAGIDNKVNRNRSTTLAGALTNAYGGRVLAPRPCAVPCSLRKHTASIVPSQCGLASPGPPGRPGSARAWPAARCSLPQPPAAQAAWPCGPRS